MKGITHLFLVMVVFFMIAGCFSFNGEIHPVHIIEVKKNMGDASNWEVTIEATRDVSILTNTFDQFKTFNCKVSVLHPMLGETPVVAQLHMRNWWWRGDLSKEFGNPTKKFHYIISHWGASTLSFTHKRVKCHVGNLFFNSAEDASRYLDAISTFNNFYVSDNHYTALWIDKRYILIEHYNLILAD